MLVLAALGALASFAALTAYVGDVRSQVGPLTTVLRLEQDIRAYDPIPPSAVTMVEVPERWLPDAALQSTAEVAGMVAGADLHAGSYLQRGMLAPPPKVAPGEREVTLTLPVDAVAPGVGRNSTVDILAAFSDKGGSKASTKVVVDAAHVLDRKLTGRSNESVRLTLALSVAETLALNYAQGFGSKITVVLVAPKSSALPSSGRTYTGPPPPSSSAKPKPKPTTPKPSTSSVSPSPTSSTAG